MIKRTLYLDSPAYLKIKNQQLTINSTDSKEPIGQIAVEDLTAVYLDHHRITITHYALQFLLSNNVAVISCNDKHMPIGIMLSLEGNTLQSKRLREQISASIALKKQLWQQTIVAKIANQASVLETTGKPSSRLKALTKEVKSGDTTNTEGTASAYYWKSYIPNFIRQPEGKYPNNLLNYGYAILRAIIARALVGTGLNPTLGIHHQNQYNAYCLADDIMEPYRPFVDAIVYKIVENTGTLINLELSKENKAKLLSIGQIDVKINKKTSPLQIAATQTTASLAKCLAGETRKIKYPQFPK